MSKRVELELVDVLGAEAGVRGPAQALLRVHTGGRVVLVPLGVAEAAQLACLLDGHGLTRPSWQALYSSSLAAGGLRVVDVQIERAGHTAGFTAHVQLGPLAPVAAGEVPATLISLVAPVDAALLIALDAGAPVFAHPSCFRAVSPRPQALIAGTDGEQPELASLLASLPDEDFGSVH